jgi:hypothetical protein
LAPALARDPVETFYTYTFFQLRKTLETFYTTYTFFQLRMTQSKRSTQLRKTPSTPCRAAVCARRLVYFSEIELRGGGTENEAARLSIGTGDVDIAWSLNIPADELAALQEEGKGEILTSFGATVEQIELSRTDPNKFTASGENSSLDHPLLLTL